MGTSIPQPERKWEYKFYREMFTLLCAPYHLGKPQVFLLCDEKSQRNDTCKCISALWILTISLDVVQIIQGKKAMLTKKEHFEDVIERHRQILKITSVNHPERKVFQKENHPKRTRNQHTSESRQPRCPLDWKQPPHSTALKRNYLIFLV